MRIEKDFREFVEFLNKNITNNMLENKDEDYNKYR